MRAIASWRMHYEHLLDAALASAKPGVAFRLAFDVASRGLLFSPALDQHPRDRDKLRSLLAQLQDHHRIGTPSVEGLRTDVDAIWSDIQGFIARSTGTIATAVGWAASVWDNHLEVVRETCGEVRTIADARPVPADVRRVHRWFASDNEELWFVRRAQHLIEAELEGELWSFPEDQLPGNTQLAFDPIARLETIRRKKLGPLKATLDVVADQGWYAKLEEGLVVCTDGSQELPTDVQYELVTAAGPLPFRVAP